MTNFMQELRSWHTEQVANVHPRIVHVIEKKSMVPLSEHEVVEEDNMSKRSSDGDVMPEEEPEFVEPERVEKEPPEGPQVLMEVDEREGAP